MSHPCLLLVNTSPVGCMMKLDDWISDLTQTRKSARSRNPVLRQCSPEANDEAPIQAPRSLKGSSPTQWYVIGLVPLLRRDKAGSEVDICGLLITKMAGSQARGAGTSEGCHTNCSVPGYEINGNSTSTNIVLLKELLTSSWPRRQAKQCNLGVCGS